MPRPDPSQTRAYAAAFVERHQIVAQLAAAGISYGQLAASLNTTPANAHRMAQVGARLLEWGGSTPPEIPPLPPPRATPRTRGLHALPDLPDGPLTYEDLVFTPAELSAIATLTDCTGDEGRRS